MGGEMKTQKRNVSTSMDLACTIAYPFALRAAVLLNVPKIIQSAGPGAALSTADICAHFANPGRASPQNLEKILEILSSNGMLKTTVEKETDTTVRVKKYALTSASDDLTWDQATDYLLFLTAPELLQMWPNMHELVLNPDAPVFEKAYGKGANQYLKEDAPELAQFFVGMMERTSATQLESLLEHYDKEFRSLMGTLVDVGGSQGAVSATIAARYPNIRRVVNFDLPDVVSGASAIPGVEHVGGSFLDSVPQGDLLIMKFVLLNWSHEETVKILRNCYNALPAKGKVIIVEKLKPDSDLEDNAGRLRTAVMNLKNALAFKGAAGLRELKQLRIVAEEAGFARVHVAKTEGDLSFIEAHKEA